MAGVLKKALAQVLVSHYAFAGEVVPNSVGEPEILCNNRGVDFVEAFADVELRDLNLYNPDDTIEGKLVPEKKHGVFAVQVWQIHMFHVTHKHKYLHFINQQKQTTNTSTDLYMDTNIYY